MTMIEWGPYEPPGRAGEGDDRDAFLRVIDELHPYLPYSEVGAFEIADDADRFAKYMRFLRMQGLRASPESWLQEQVAKLMHLDVPPEQPATEKAWTSRRRRLLVVMTWPFANGESAPEYPFPDDPEGGTTGVYGRPYWNLWSDVRFNFFALARRVEEQPEWRAAASQWGIASDLFRETASLGLVNTPDGQPVSGATADALVMSDIKGDSATRAAIARSGFLLCWWDIVALAECAGFAFHPVPAEARRSHGEGEFHWDRRGLVARLGNALSDRRPSPDELHRRYTAGGLITPPAPGSKYRALFEHLDSKSPTQMTVIIGREELENLTSRSEFRTRRPIRGSRGEAGLPSVAVKNPTWWYGPWNPDHATTSPKSDPPVSLEELGRRSHSRAWMAAGFRAKPNIPLGTARLVDVWFEPVDGREAWWPWRESLRDNTYESVRIVQSSSRASQEHRR